MAGTRARFCRRARSCLVSIRPVSLTGQAALYPRLPRSQRSRLVAIGRRGLTYRMLGRYEDALADFSRAIELDPENAGVAAERGGTYRLMKRWKTRG